MADINLIPLEEKAQERVELTQKRLQFISVGFLVFSAVATLITLLMYTTSVSKKNDLIGQVEESSAKINQYKPQEERLVVTKDKVSAANKLLGNRVDFNVFFSNMASIIPQDVYFTDLRIADTKVTISGKARSSKDVAGLVSSLTAARGAELISNVAIDTLSSDETGVYSFVISGKLAGVKK